MAEFLHTLLVLTVLGSALTGLLLLARPLIKSRTVFYYLWLLVLLRLCLPVGVSIPLPARAQTEPPRTGNPQPVTQPAQPGEPGLPSPPSHRSRPDSREGRQRDSPSRSPYPALTGRGCSPARLCGWPSGAWARPSAWGGRYGATGALPGWSAAAGRLRSMRRWRCWPGWTPRGGWG